MFAWAVFLGAVLRSWAAAGEPANRRIDKSASAESVSVSTPHRFRGSLSYHVTRYTAEQGLPQNTVRALLQTRDGYLWIGTLAGLARFDGVRFKVFDMNNTPEMSSDAINALAEDQRDGSLWINTGNELLRYRAHRFERFHEQAGFPHPIGRLWPARQGGLWYSPLYGQLVLLQNHTVRTWQLLPHHESDPNYEILAHRINQVEEQENNSLLVLVYRGLFRFAPATGTLTQLGPPADSDTSYRHFYKQTDGRILVAAREGLWLVSEDGRELIQAVPPGDRQCPAQIHPAGNGEFWIPWGDNGPPRLARFRADHSEFLDLSSLPDYPVNELLQDREGHLWMGTESGLCQLRPKAVQVYAREQGLRNDYVKSVTAGPEDTIWLGTAEGVSGIKNGQVTNLPPVEPSYWGRAEGLLADRRGRVWYGVHYETVVAFDRGAWISLGELSPSKGWVRTLYEDRVGRIWAATDRGIAWLDETGAVHVLSHALSHPDVRVIHEDRRGDFWFGTFGGGLNRLHDDQINAYTTTLGEYNNQAWWIHEDADGVFWVGTPNGLNRFVPPGAEPIRNPQSAIQNQLTQSIGNLSGIPPGVEARETPAAGAMANRKSQIANSQSRFFTFTTRHGLYENTINNIQEDDSGNLWLSGLQGIYRVSRRELNNVAAGRQARAQVLAFGEADGMLNSQCNGGVNQPSGCKDRAGCIWFPTARGVAMVDPRTIRRNEVPPPVVIEQVRADEEVVYGDGAAADVRRLTSEIQNPKSKIQKEQSLLTSAATPRLAPGRARVLEIRYTANSFAAPHRMRFKYQLEGVDRDWSYDDQNRRVAFYTSLRPGAYAFHVTACNNHGVWSQVPATFSFTLAPHFWQTRLFYILAGAAFIGLAAAVQAYRLRWQRRVLTLQQQHALADERTRIARDLHDDLGTALTGLSLELEVIRRDAPDGPTLTSRLAESAARIRALAERMREVVWAVNPRCDTVSSLASFLEQQAGQFLKTDGPRCRLEFPEDIPPLPLDGETRHQLALSMREALSNAVRHAAASEIVLGLRIQADQLVVWITDNGRGFCVAEGQAAGHGLANIRSRLEKIGGQCECHSKPGAGTTLEMRVPLPRC
jgi:ligand-binding sensor domain-containing protein/signal transduction histidine kinase